MDEAACQANPLLFELSKLDTSQGGTGSGDFNGLFYVMVDSDSKLLNAESAYEAAPANLPYVILHDRTSLSDLLATKPTLRKMTLVSCKNDARIAFLVFDKAPTQLNIQVVRSPYGFHNGAKPYIPGSTNPTPTGHKVNGLARPNSITNHHAEAPQDCIICESLVNALVDMNVVSFTANYNGQVSLRAIVTNTSSSVLYTPTLRITSLYDGFIPGASEPVTREIVLPISITSPNAQGGWAPGASLPITLNVRLDQLQGFDFYIDVYASVEQDVFNEVDRDNISTYIQLTRELLMTNAHASVYLPIVQRN